MPHFTTVCAWCGKVLNRVRYHKDVVSHGICLECRAKVFQEYVAQQALKQTPKEKALRK